MSKDSNIEWTESTWNPVTGCTKISTGCKNCYAERMANRLKAMGQQNYRHGFKVQTHSGSLYLPLSWKKPQTIFVNSMSDLFHEEVPDEFIFRIFEVMKQAQWHRFQVLTKRSDRLLKLDKQLEWQPNIWMGVTVESNKYLNRIDDLRKTHAFIKFLSMEPLLSGFEGINLKKINWVIAGGESGPGARPVEPDWVRDVRNACIKQNTPFFFKQWGGTRKKVAGRQLDGRLWSEMPTSSFV
jgi:protein gp37